MDEPSPEIQLLESGDAKYPDTELPIAERKESRSCTQHSINKYVSYPKFSRKYKCFILSLSSSVIPKYVDEVKKDHT